MGASILLQALSPPRRVFFLVRRPPASPGTELAGGAQREPLPLSSPAPYPQPASCLVLSCSGPGGSQEPRGFRDCPLPFPRLGPGPPPRPLPELWVEKPALREWPCLLSGGEGFISKITVRARGHPHISKVQRSGAPPGGRGFISPWLPSSHPPLSTLLWPPSGSTMMPKPNAPDGPQCRTVPLAFYPRCFVLLLPCQLTVMSPV